MFLNSKSDLYRGLSVDVKVWFKWIFENSCQDLYSKLENIFWGNVFVTINWWVVKEVDLTIIHNCSVYIIVPWHSQCYLLEFHWLLISEIWNVKINSHKIYLSQLFNILSMYIWVRVMEFNAKFNNISVISWRSVYWWRKPKYLVCLSI